MMMPLPTCQRPKAQACWYVSLDVYSCEHLNYRILDVIDEVGNQRKENSKAILSAVWLFRHGWGAKDVLLSQ